MSDQFWKKKLAAWLHDPAEKALVLMRDVDDKGRRIGHEDGSLKDLRAALGITKADFEPRADHLAAGADRPSWPEDKDGFRPAWANVRFVEQPVLIHPLSGENISLGKLDDIQAAHVRNASLQHFLGLIERDAQGQIDYRLTLLAFWRFGPEPALAAPEIGDLWRLLPADTRVPDHSIWAHLDIVSAITGALSKDQAGKGEPALLAMSFGPVQSFIAQARSTSDLWAGSHLLASLVWEGVRVIAEELGPDAVLFPSLRGVATVDKWLLRQVTAERHEAWRARFMEIKVDWLERATDANPLFAATLPNKFMALVPDGRGADLARKVTDAVRRMALRLAIEAGAQVFGNESPEAAHWRTQVAAQLAGFPETHWAIAAWPQDLDESGMPDTAPIEQALAAFYPASDAAPGFFNEPLWRMLTAGEVVTRKGSKRSYRKVVVDGAHEFFAPNHGLLYPAVHDLAERTLAATKTHRPFAALAQHGFRCTLCGEREWLTDAPEQLALPPKGRSQVSTWSKKAGEAGIKKGEHLCGVCTLKRMWPRLFVDQVADVLEGDKPDRFVISTHTMALAGSLARLVKEYDGNIAGQAAALLAQVEQDAPVALPASLDRALRQVRDDTFQRVVRRLPAALDRERAADDRADSEGNIGRKLRQLIDGDRPETYYALIKMDGDRMGAWMAGNETEYQRRFVDTWHPQVRTTVTQRFGSAPEIKRYLESFRPASPARHAAISAVLNNFSTHVARHVIENVFKGKLIYAGGDDVLAMVSVDDLLPAILLLRAAYSGNGDVAGLPGTDDLKGLQLGRGFVHLNGRLLTMMGSHATASVGAIIAHHQAPLAGVLRQLDGAEHAAKAHGRNAFCLRIIKRGGGEVGVTARFWDVGNADATPLLKDSPPGFMLRLAHTLAHSDFSRRAIYKAQQWLADLPPRPAKEDGDWREMVATHLAWQFGKQGGIEALAHEAVALVCSGLAPATALPATRQTQREAVALESLLVTAEFFAREGRAFKRSGEFA